MDEFNEQVEHLAKLARSTGWWRYAQARAMELEAEAPVEFAGLRNAVRDRLKATGFRPPPQELRE